MNIKDFLLDNYIWILVVILLAIVTVIGFLADKKNKGTNKKGVVNSDNSMQPQGQINNNMNQVQSMNMNQVNSIPNNNQFMVPNNAVMPNNMNSNGVNNNFVNSNVNTTEPTQVVQPIADVGVKDGMMETSIPKPLSEQTPTFAPQNVNIINPQPMQQNDYNNGMVNQQTVNPYPNQYVGNVGYVSNQGEAPVSMPQSMPSYSNVGMNQVNYNQNQSNLGQNAVANTNVVNNSTEQNTNTTIPTPTMPSVNSTMPNNMNSNNMASTLNFVYGPQQQQNNNNNQM